jgi:N6-adenosine-specific RNA methylase IME4
LGLTVTSADFVHCNVDIDVIAWEGDPQGRFCHLAVNELKPADPHLKPPELLKVVENFCLGNRRLHIGGSSKSLRAGWLTISQDLDSSEMAAARAYDKDQVDSFFMDSANQVVPNTPGKLPSFLLTV